ncbi:MAG: hypothetical protein KH354_03870 [Clostridiales bacterium]|nr:hypothetical protein [Clostridiales bacterium]
MTEDELIKLDKLVWDEIERKKMKKEKELEAYVKGLAEGEEMMIKAIRKFFIEEEKRKEH